MARRLAELLNGDSLVVTGPGGLTLVLAGGPPPRPVSLRSAVQGASGLHLRMAAEAAKLPQVAAPDFARRLIGRRAPALPLPAEILAELASIWPATNPPGRASTPPDWQSSPSMPPASLALRVERSGLAGPAESHNEGETRPGRSCHWLRLSLEFNEWLGRPG